MKTEIEPMTHVFLKPCGCLSCALVDVPQNFGELAKAYRYAQKHGETYKKMVTEDVRHMQWKCLAHKKTQLPLRQELPVRVENDHANL